MERARQIGAALAAPYSLSGHGVTCSASIGVVSSLAGFDTADAYLRAADSAMYRAKSQSLGVCVFSPGEAEARTGNGTSGPSTGG